MNSRQFLDAYLHDLRGRLRNVVLLRAAAAAALLALLVTVVAVWALQRTGFPVSLAVAVRSGFALALAALAAVLLWQPLRKLARGQGAREMERHVPQQNGRIDTYLELAARQKQGLDAPMIDLLADDAAAVAKTAPIGTVVPRRRLLVPAVLASVAAAGLVLLMTAGSSYWGFGSRYLWLGMAVPEDQVLLRRVVVSPGDTKVRRNQDLAIRAVIQGFDASDGELFVRAGAASRWERAGMRADGKGGFELTLYALREPLRYYVKVAGVQSAEHRVEVVDLPQVERVRLTYRYPQWTGLTSRSDTAPEIRAVVGTRVELEIQTTAPLTGPALVVNGSTLPLESEGRIARGSLVVAQSGEYRVSTRFGDETVALTEDHPIVVIADEKPSIEILKPGRDWRATSIEEVPVQVRAGDDFNLQGLELRYAVNGGDWQRVALGANTRQIDAGTLLRLEEMGTTPAANLLSPGDIVSYYAVARDRQQTVQTDLFLIQVQPFERRVTQSQAMSGQGEEQQNGISERQREILLATWNLQRAREQPGTRGAERVADNARMLSEVQKTLAGQARSLIDRTRARMMVAPGSDTERFITNLELAEKAMQPAAARLSEIELAKAVPAEQSALQYLLRAEAVYSDIQMALQRDLSGAGGSQSNRDLAEMFELEMDLEKNQYETASRLAEAEASSPEKLDEMIRKLRELAERQEKLAQEAAKDRSSSSQQQRWKQEQLKRETEQLRQRLAELKKQAQQQASRQQSGGAGGGQGEPQDGEPSDGESSSAESMAAAIEELERALDNMENASKRAGAQLAENQAGNRDSAGNTERDGAKRDGEKRDAADREAAGRDGASRDADGRDAANRDAAGREGADRGTQQAGDAADRNGRGTPQERADNRAAQAASRNLRRAIDEIERNKRATVANDFKDLEARARGLLDTQRRSEDALQAAAGDVRDNVRAGRSGVEQRSGLAENKRDLQSQLQSLEGDIGAVAQRHKKDAPRASSQLSTAAKNLSESSIHSRLSRSANDIARGRLQEATSSQGLITESLEGLQQDLSEAAQVAATEAAQSPSEDDSAADMLAELTAIRRAWEEAQSRPQTPLEGPQRGEGQAPNPASANRDPSQLIGGRPGGLDVWLPPVGRGPPPRSDTPEFREEALATADRLRNLQRRLPRGAFAPPDTRALEELTQRLRGKGTPSESDSDRILALTQQLELAALKAAEKQNASTTRATNPASDSPQYRNSVAEYYRRLGGERKTEK